MSVPKMAPEVEPKPYYQNQKRIVDSLPETRLEGNHYITTEPEWVTTKGACEGVNPRRAEFVFGL
jgi:hypothetical protein